MIEQPNEVFLDWMLLVTWACVAGTFFFSAALVLLKLGRAAAGRYWRRRAGHFLALMEAGGSGRGPRPPLRPEWPLDGWILEGLLAKLAAERGDRDQTEILRVFEEAGLAQASLRRLNSSRRWWVRAEAAHRLGEMRAKRAEEALIAALEDDQLDVVLESAWALGRIQSRKSLPAIIRIMPRLMVGAALRIDSMLFAFGRLSVPILTEMALRPEFKVSILSIHLLAEFEEPRSLAVFRRLADHPNPELRMAATKALGRLDLEASRKALRARMGDADWRVRAVAARALGRLRDAKALPLLEKALADPKWSVRYHSGRSLSLHGEKGRAALERGLGSANRFVRDMSAQWLDLAGAA